MISLTDTSLVNSVLVDGQTGNVTNNGQSYNFKSGQTTVIVDIETDPTMPFGSFTVMSPAVVPL